MYVDGSSVVHYPEGNDWGTLRRAHFAELDVVVRAYGRLVAEKAPVWEGLHAQKALDAARAAEMWLTKWLDHQGALVTTNTAEQIVIDNADRGVAVVGSWTTGNPAPNGPQVFGPSVRYKAAGSGSAYVRFDPRMSQTRTYDVYAWWVAAPSQATNTPFTVNYAGGSTVITKNQQINGGQWNLLGTFAMGPATTFRSVTTLEDTLSPTPSFSIRESDRL